VAQEAKDHCKEHLQAQELLDALLGKEKIGGCYNLIATILQDD
jgi:hypothetical protein